jgi:hypothetical protein
VALREKPVQMALGPQQDSFILLRLGTGLGLTPKKSIAYERTSRRRELDVELASELLPNSPHGLKPVARSWPTQSSESIVN